MADSGSGRAVSADMVFPWDYDSYPERDVRCDECGECGPVTVWEQGGEVVKVLHGRCMRTEVRLVTDELAARRAER